MARRPATSNSNERLAVVKQGIAGNMWPASDKISRIGPNRGPFLDHPWVLPTHWQPGLQCWRWANIRGRLMPSMMIANDGGSWRKKKKGKQRHKHGIYFIHDFLAKQ